MAWDAMWNRFQKPGMVDEKFKYTAQKIYILINRLNKFWICFQAKCLIDIKLIMKIFRSNIKTLTIQSDF